MVGFKRDRRGIRLYCVLSIQLGTSCDSSGWLQALESGCKVASLCTRAVVCKVTLHSVCFCATTCQQALGIVSKLKQGWVCASSQLCTCLSSYHHFMMLGLSTHSST